MTTDAPLRGLGAQLRVFEQEVTVKRQAKSDDLGYEVDDITQTETFYATISLIRREESSANLVGIDITADAFMFVQKDKLPSIDIQLGDIILDSKNINWRIVEVRDYTWGILYLLERLHAE